jgi:DNA mismatch endonuclease (patch repair protein)
VQNELICFLTFSGAVCMSKKMPKATKGQLMARIRSKNTGPELEVRRLVHSLGYRYRLHRSDLPGTPDLAFVSQRKAVFVHGCFWHQHQNCRKSSLPNTRRSFWIAKFARNAARDQRALDDLEALGWKTLVVWECEISDRQSLSVKIRMFLDNFGKQERSH